MKRSEIKKEAWKKIKGNKWNIWWPVLVISFFEGLVTTIVGPKANIDLSNIQTVAPELSPIQIIVLIIAAIISGLFMAGYYKYILNFVRTGKFETNSIIETVKNKWANILIAIVLVTVIVSICSLVIIPGIILAFAYTFSVLIVVDTDVSGSDALKASREMMKGYKWNYFVFMFSFIGWIILCFITLGIASIWAIPYVTVAEVMYYDKLKALKK